MSSSAWWGRRAAATTSPSLPFACSPLLPAPLDLRLPALPRSLDLARERPLQSLLDNHQAADGGGGSRGRSSPPGRRTPTRSSIRQEVRLPLFTMSARAHDGRIIVGVRSKRTRPLEARRRRADRGLGLHPDPLRDDHGGRGARRRRDARPHGEGRFARSRIRHCSSTFRSRRLRVSNPGGETPRRGALACPSRVGRSVECGAVVSCAVPAARILSGSAQRSGRSPRWGVPGRGIA